MPAYPFVTLDVFTDRRFGGNPLAVFPDARGLSDADMQVASGRVQPERDHLRAAAGRPRQHGARAHLHAQVEMPFAGHPNVGTGWVLAQEGRDRDGVLLFEEIAGLVEVRVDRERGGRADGRDHRRAAAAVARAGDAGGDGRGTCAGSRPPTWWRARIARCWPRSATRSSSRR